MERAMRLMGAMVALGAVAACNSGNVTGPSIAVPGPGGAPGTTPVSSVDIQGSGTLVTEVREVSGFSRVTLHGVGHLTIEQGGAEALTRSLARFESERQALALMNHPNIARVFDAGATEDGRPYFAMEHVRGVPITDYCDTHRLSIEERLELFIQVCDGVQHAHQKGVIHRDIKPSNVLVTIQDDKPVPEDHRFRRGQGHRRHG